MINHVLSCAGLPTDGGCSSEPVPPSPLLTVRSQKTQTDGDQHGPLVRLPGRGRRVLPAVERVGLADAVVRRAHVQVRRAGLGATRGLKG